MEALKDAVERGGAPSPDEVSITGTGVGSTPVRPSRVLWTSSTASERSVTATPREFKSGSFNPTRILLVLDEHGVDHVVVGAASMMSNRPDSRATTTSVGGFGVGMGNAAPAAQRLGRRNSTENCAEPRDSTSWSTSGGIACEAPATTMTSITGSVCARKRSAPSSTRSRAHVPAATRWARRRPAGIVRPSHVAVVRTTSRSSGSSARSHRGQSNAVPTRCDRARSSKTHGVDRKGGL